MYVHGCFTYIYVYVLHGPLMIMETILGVNSPETGVRQL